VWTPPFQCDENQLWYSPGESIFFTGPWGKWECGTADHEMCSTIYYCEIQGCACCPGNWGSPGISQGPEACPTTPTSS